MGFRSHGDARTEEFARVPEVVVVAVVHMMVEMVKKMMVMGVDW